MGMKSILFLGYSNLLKQRILPILPLTGFRKVGIAKYEGQEWDNYLDALPYDVTIFDNFERGLEGFSSDIVYVSTVNSTHYMIAKQVLEAGMNVIVDKPATMTANEADSLLGLAKQGKLLCAESTVYLEHPQFSRVREVFVQNGDSPKLLTVHFSMPPFLSGNFRYRKDLGGGALLDTLPYAVSICRYFFHDYPERVEGIISERNPDGLDLEYSLLLVFPGGRTMVGHFGFNTEYMNHVSIIGNRTNVSFDRVFTIPDTLENVIRVDHMNEHDEIYVARGNNFRNFFDRIESALDEGDYSKFEEDLRYDAIVRQQIINKLQ